jgi:hypothetical protein
VACVVSEAIVARRPSLILPITDCSSHESRSARHIGSLDGNIHGGGLVDAVAEIGLDLAAHLGSLDACFGQRNGNGGQGWIRTSVHLREQIYSLPPLTTRPPVQVLPAKGGLMTNAGLPVNATAAKGPQ